MLSNDCLFVACSLCRQALPGHEIKQASPLLISQGRLEASAGSLTFKSISLLTRRREVDHQIIHYNVFSAQKIANMHFSFIPSFCRWRVGYFSISI